MKKAIYLGSSDYKEIIEDDCYYIDKTLLIEELLLAKKKVNLICRPRRFGKTLNLSMLKYFFEYTKESNSHLFENKKIWNNKQIFALQGTYPVIYITFKDTKKENFAKSYEHICLLISKEFERHRPILLSKLDEHNSKKYNSIIDGSASMTAYEESLFFLSEILSKHYNKKVMLFFDEYDTPIHAAYLNDYYKELVNFIKALFSRVLKDNIYLQTSVLTGILRTAKEGIFSDLNNLSVYTMISEKYDDKFGFTFEEVKLFLEDYNLLNQIDNIKNWYNGYHIGKKTLVYNPWSILSCVENKGELKPYWVNTSDNALIKKLLAISNENVKKDLEDILNNVFITKMIEESFTFENINQNENALWNLLLFSGYLTHSTLELTDNGENKCTLKLPNHEIKTLFQKLLESIFVETLGNRAKADNMIKALISGDLEIFSETLQEFIINSMSFHDFNHSEPEKSYHLFILGLLVNLSDTYIVKSNRESGHGRYDIMLIPKKKSDNAIVIEFKKSGKQTLEESAQSALKQINEKNYAQSLKEQDITNIIAYGISFKGKELLIKLQKIN